MKSKILVLICTVVLSMIANSAFAGGKSVYFFFSNSPSYQYVDENVTVTIFGMQLIIRNKTDHVIYLDKETSFAYLNDAATCLFSNAVYTSSKSQGSNSNVNLGGVARAMGVGGGLGALMSGIDVGGNQTQGSSTTTYEQKIVTIAPQSAYAVYSWVEPSKDAAYNFKVFLYKNHIINASFNAYIDPYTQEKTKFKKGQTWQYKEYVNSPLRLKGVINYYESQDAQEPIQAMVNNYVSNIIVDEKEIKDATLCAPYKEWDYKKY